MKVWICDECGREVKMGEKPDTCACGAKHTYIEIEKPEGNGAFGCGGPKA